MLANLYHILFIFYNILTDHTSKYFRFVVVIKNVEIKEDDLGRDMWEPLPRQKRLPFFKKSRTIGCQAQGIRTIQ